MRDLMVDTLLPCPFCGEKAADYCETNAWWVRCTECNAETEADISPEAAAEIWNRRTSPPQTHVAGIEEGIERAARYIEKQRDEYVQEYGMYDGTTGVTEFSNGGEEYLSTLEELIDGIRALPTTESKS